MTNFERSREEFLNADTPEKMAELFIKLKIDTPECDGGWCETGVSCKECIRNWLEKEPGEGDYD